MLGHQRKRLGLILVAVAIACLVFGRGANAGVDGLEEKLSQRGKVFAQCIAYYEALMQVIEETDPSVKSFSGAISKETAPLMVRLHVAAENRADQLKQAFPKELVELAKAEIERVIAGYKKEISTKFPNYVPRQDTSLVQCAEHNSWLHRRGVKLTGWYYFD